MALACGGFAPEVLANDSPYPEISVDGYGYGATVVRPSGGSVDVTVRFTATDSDDNLSGIRYNIWHPSGAYFDNGGDAFEPQSGGSGEVVRTVTLDSDGDWYFWTDAEDGDGAYASTGDWTSGFRLIVATNQPPAVHLTSPGNQTITVGTSLTIASTSSDGDGNMTAHHLDIQRPDGQWNFEGGWSTQWPFQGGPNGNGSNSSKSAEFTFDQTGVWHVRAAANDGFGWQHSTEVTITVVESNSAPQTNWVTVSPSNITSGQAVTFRGNASDPDSNLKYIQFYAIGPNGSGYGPNWTPVPDHEVDASGGSATVELGFTPNMPGNWSVHIRAEDTDGVWDSNGNIAANFTVSPLATPPTITTQPSSASAPVGGSVTFSVVANGNPAPTYQWRKGGVNIAATAASFTLAGLQLSDAGNYDVVVSNSAGTATSVAAVLTVTSGYAQGDAYYIRNIEYSGTVIEDQTSADLHIEAGDDPATPEVTAVNVLSGASVTYGVASMRQIRLVPGFHAAAGSHFHAQIGGVGGGGVPQPPIITSQPQSQTVSVGATAWFSVAASGAAPLTYQWRRAGAVIAGATNASLALSNVQFGDAAQYDVVVSNSAGTATSTAATLTVLAYSNPNDLDGDGMSDDWERQWFPDLAQNGLGDLDLDGLTDVAEYNRDSDPSSSSSPGPSTLGDEALDATWLSTAAEYVGFTPGAAGVNLSGAATYSVPLKVTPGTAGMQPNLGLEYSSQAGDGYVGLGWQLRGLSVISRGPATFATDGFARGVSFSAQDRFYLDGARLIAISGDYGANLTEYRTEIDSFSRIVSYGSAGSGPAYFKVWTKSGQVLEFGMTANSRLTPAGRSEPLIWAVSSISDLSANSMKVEYTPTSPSNEILPDKISYTCNTAAPAGYATVKFDYKVRTDPQSGFAFDASTVSTKVLEKVTVKNGTSVFRQYRLSYHNGTSTQPSRLKSIQETAEELEQATKIYPATTFDYYAPPTTGLGYGAQNSQIIAGAGVASFGVDMDGDGLTDLLRVYNDSAAKVELYRNDGSNFVLDSNTASQQLLLSGADFSAGWFLTTDMDGDGKSELIVNPTVGALPTGRIRRIKVASATTLTPYSDIDVIGYHDMGMALPCYSADFSGDGRDDLLLVRLGLPGRVQMLVSTGTNYTPYDFSNVPDLKNGLIEIGDFTGDGIADILNVVDEANDRRIRVFSVSTTGVSLVDETVLGIKRPMGDWRIMIADVNGDGQLDLLYSYKSTNGTETNANMVEIWIRKGHGSGPARFVHTASQWMGGWSSEQFRYVPFDYDGDRKTDIAILYKPAADETRLAVWQAAGPESAPFTGIDIGAFFTGWMPQHSLSPAQLDRDGLGDLLFVGFVSDKNHVMRLLSKPSAAGQPGAFPHLLSVVTNGLGAKTKFSYLSLLAEDIYTSGTGSAWPDADVRPPFRVVSIMESDRSGGASAAVSYTYGGLRVNAHRGFRGFEWIKRYDSTTGLEAKSGYYQAFPLTNLPKYSEVRNGTEDGAGVLISRTEADATTSVASGVHRPYIESSYSKEYDLAGNAARTRYSKIVQDGYGNVTNAYERAAPGIVAKASMAEGQSLPAGYFERKVTTTFSHDVSGSNWFVNRPTSIASYAKSGDYPAEGVTRTTGMSYHEGTNRVQFVTQEPDAGGEAYRVQTEYGYDTFGNVNTVTVSSPAAGDGAIATRVTSTDYTNSTDHPIAGRFPRHVTDALSQKTSFVYDVVTGQLKKRRDEASGLETTWTYDAFGVQTFETRPDSTTTTTTYRWDTSSVAMENGSSAAAKYHLDVRSSGVPPALTRFDALGLPIQQVSVAGDGVSRFTETRYDARGNAVATSRPHRALTPVYWTTTAYDALNRPFERYTPAPPPPNSAEGTPSGIDGFSWQYTGLSVTATDARGLETKRTANALGLPESVENNPGFASTAPDRSKLGYKYDGFGNLRAATDAANHTVNTTYDRLGRKLQVVDPNMGTWSYAYYANGLLRTQTDAKGNVTAFTYDKLDRSNGETIGNRVVSRVYKINASTTPLAGARQLDQATVTEGGTPVFQQTWSYDGQSRVSGTTRAFGNKNYTFAQTYDSFSRPEVTTYPLADSASFATVNVYNGAGYLKEIRRRDLAGYPSDGLGQIYWQAADYEDDGQLRQAYLGNGAAVDRMHYAENGRPAGDGLSVNPPHGSEELPALLLQSYGFDGVGNLISRGVGFVKTDGSPTSYTETFTYDGMNRVQYVDHSTAGRMNTYVYNPIGNLTSKDGQTFDYTRTIGTEPLAPHAVRSALGASYTYDANGNLTGNSPGTLVTWRTFNQPDRITRGTEWSEFTYGADDERILQTTQDGTQTRYVGSLYEVTVPQGNASLTEVRAYVMTPLGRTAVVQFDGGGTTPTSTRYLTQDQITSTSLVTDEAGRVRERFSHDPWGAPRNPQTLATSTTWPVRAATTRGFTDHEMLSRLQLVHMNGRIYNPALGRFLSPDPFVNESDGTQMLNRYAYVRNNPLSLTDPTGYFTPYVPNGGDVVRLPSFEVRAFPLPAWPGKPSWMSLAPTSGITTGVSTSTNSQAWLNQLNPNNQPMTFYSPVFGFEDEEEFDSGHGETGLRGWLLDNGLMVDNRQAMAKAMGRWQGAVDADATWARARYFWQYAWLRIDGEYALPPDIQMMVGMALPGGGRSMRPTRTNGQLVQEIATRTERAIGGTGRFAGTEKHVYAKRFLDKYQRIYGNRGLLAETTWLRGQRKSYGTKDATRIDVLDVNASYAFDYKFTTRPPALKQSQSQRIINNGPPGIQRVIEVNP